MTDVRITVLVENTAGGRGLLAEHGLSFWIEVGKNRYLFDAGQGLALCHNVQRLGIRLNSADGVVLSHGHYDHTGGLREALDHIMTFQFSRTTPLLNQNTRSIRMGPVVMLEWTNLSRHSFARRPT